MKIIASFLREENKLDFEAAQFVTVFSDISTGNYTSAIHQRWCSQDEDGCTDESRPCSC